MGAILVSHFVILPKMLYYKSQKGNNCAGELYHMIWPFLLVDNQQ